MIISHCCDIVFFIAGNVARNVFCYIKNGKEVKKNLSKMEIFTRNLKSLLQKRKMTHKDLRDLTGIKTASMSRYANGQTCPSARDLYAIARALGVSMDFLWAGSEFSNMETMPASVADVVHDNDAVADAFAVILDAVEKRRARRNVPPQP